MRNIKKGETKKEYAIKMHWAGNKHIYIARKLGWTGAQVHKAVFGD